jgi:K+-transporting ATPase c subunit
MTRIFLLPFVSACRSEELVRGEVAKATDNPLLSLGGNPRVNIVKLNLALDALTPKSGLAEKKS